MIDRAEGSSAGSPEGPGRDPRRCHVHVDGGLRRRDRDAGILLDPAIEGLPFSAYAVTSHDVEQAEKRQGVALGRAVF
ncbi:hypothetical protein [Nonomuraea jabiensis]|uniref:hypothetical protein n=1 Tax=Nonomuraea jabiensis TaxID=882448 RepID=UPI0036766FE8